MTDRRILIAGFGAVALGLALAGKAVIDHAIAADAALLEFGAGSAPFSENPRLVAALRADGRRIGPLHAAKAPPKRGDWLDLHEESQQSFDVYRRGSVQHPGGRRTTLYVQPWGAFDEAQSRVVAATAEGLSRFFGVPVKPLEPLDLAAVPEWAREPHPRRGDRRLMTSFALSELRKYRPADGFAIVAFTPVDLTRTGRGTWAFGQASLFDGVAVCSLYRHGDPRSDFTTCLRRNLKTAIHETGHALGISHCVDFECAMNGSNSREEADSRPLWFCPEDEQKVWLACQVDRDARYARLAEFATAHKLEEEARFWLDSQAALGGRHARASGTR